VTDAELVTFLKGEADIRSLESCNGEPVTSLLLKAADRLAALKQWTKEEASPSKDQK